MTDSPQAPDMSKRLAYIGNVCTQWSAIEYQVAQCIWWMLKLDNDTGKIVTGGLDMLPRLNMAINLARHLKVPHDLTAQLVSTRAAIQDKLDVRRNRAVHGVQFYYPADGEITVEVHRGKGGRERKPAPEDELHDLGKRLHGIGKLLFAVIKPLRDQRRAEDVAIKMRSTASDANSVPGS